MKKQLLIIIFISIALAVSTSCSSDDDSAPSRDSRLIFEEADFAVNEGFVEFYRENNAVPGEEQSYKMELYLYGGDIRFYEQISNFTGEGPLFYLDLNSSSQDGLVSGTYSFDSSDDRLVNTFQEGLVSRNYDTSNREGELLVIQSGEVEISVSGSSYTVDGTIFLAGFEPVVIEFTGTLEEYNFN